MSRSLLGLIFLAGGVLIAGCASNDLMPFDEDPEVQKIVASVEAPMGLRLAVAPIWTRFDASEINSNPGANRFAVDFDPRTLREQFTEVLASYNIFEDVGVVDGETIGECIDNAFNAEYDIVMELNLNRFDVHYEGVNGWYAPNLINYALFIWTAWWVADEIYGANLELDMALWSAHSGELLIEPVLYNETQLRELDDFERGWKLTGSIFIPGGLEADNWAKIHKVVMPFAIHEVKRDLLRSMAEDFRGLTTSPDGEFAKAMAKTMAVVVGVTRHEDFLVHNLRYADADARAFSEFLQDRSGADIPSKNIRTFENHTATLANVKTAFDFVGKYCREDDTVFFFFAGYGAVEKMDGEGGDGYKKYLLFADSVVDDLPGTALSIEDLDALCDALPAQNVVLFLDTSFSAPGETRSYVDVRKPPEEIQLSDDYLKTLTDMPGRIVLAACSPDQGALMLDEEQQGLFTHYFLEGTKPAQNPTDKEFLTLKQILDYALPAAEDRADIEGQPQTPTIVGEGADTINLVDLRYTGDEADETEEPFPEDEEMPEEELPGGGG